MQRFFTDQVVLHKTSILIFMCNTCKASLLSSLRKELQVTSERYSGPDMTNHLRLNCGSPKSQWEKES